MKYTYIGIDPGVHGALAYICDDGYGVFDFENEAQMSKVIEDISLTTDKPLLAALEEVGVIFGAGKKSNLTLGMNLGWWKGILRGNHIPFELVKPKVWRGENWPKKKYKMDKNHALETARNLFPKATLHLKKHHDRAEALLIAEWNRRNNG